MKKIGRVSTVLVYSILFVGMFLMYSCSGSSSGSGSESGSTGSVTFSLQMPVSAVSSVSGSEVVYKAASIDCDRLGIVSVEAEVLDENEHLIAEGGPWECNAGEGIIYGVKPGNNRVVLIYLKDENGAVLYSGSKSEITVIAGQTTDAGTIILVEGEEEGDNHPPTAVDDSARVVRGGRISMLDTDETSVTANDYDEDGDSLVVSTTPLSGPYNGSVILYQDGTFVYTHDGSDTTSDSFIYEVSDGNGGSASATVNITVLNGATYNNPPVLSNGGVSPDSGDPQETFTFSVHYQDPDGHAASVMDVSINGTVCGMSLSDGTAYNGTYTYQTTLEEGEYSYFFMCSDGYGGSTRLPAAEVFTGPVVAVANHGPTAENDHASTVQGGRTQGNVLENDYDEDGDSLVVSTTPLNGPYNGSVTLNKDGTFVYTHNGSETKSDSFTYEVSDGKGGSATATVSITVSLDPDDNHAPLLSGGAVSLGAGDVSDTFSFSVHYSDEDGHEPQDRYVYIDGKAYDMSLLSGSTYDGTYSVETDLTAGEHEYYFAFTDGYGGSARLPEAGAYKGPCVADRAYFVSCSRGSDDYEGTRAYPFATIGHAIDVVQGSEDTPATIFVAAGTYEENLSLDSWESLSGGWLDDFSLQWDFSNNGITPAQEYETVIDGGQAGRCITADHVQGASMSGLTLVNGNAGDYEKGGAAVYLGSCSAEISFCTIKNNTTVSGNNICGGALYNDGSDLTVSRCLFADNTVTGPHIKYGGALYNYRSAPRITGCVFENNHAGCNMGAGGAIYNFESDAEIIDSVFTGNSTGGYYSYGAGIYNEFSNPLVANCMFSANTASGSYTARGGAVYNRSSSPIIANCSFSLNSATSGSGKSMGGGIYSDAASAPVIINAVLWGDTAVFGTELFNEKPFICRISYCDIEQDMGESETIHDNISTDPLFVDADSGDLHLSADSPCIDAGISTVEWIMKSDIDGDPRIVNDYIDMGADEFVE